MKLKSLVVFYLTLKYKLNVWPVLNANDTISTIKKKFQLQKWEVAFLKCLQQCNTTDNRSAV